MKNLADGMAAALIEQFENMRVSERFVETYNKARGVVKQVVVMPLTEREIRRIRFELLCFQAFEICRCATRCFRKRFLFLSRLDRERFDAFVQEFVLSMQREMESLGLCEHAEISHDGSAQVVSGAVGHTESALECITGYLDSRSVDAALDRLRIRVCMGGLSPIQPPQPDTTSAHEQASVTVGDVLPDEQVRKYLPLEAGVHFVLDWLGPVFTNSIVTRVLDGKEGSHSGEPGG